MSGRTDGRTDLAASVGELILANPVMVGSGCGGTGRELEPFGVTGLGAFVTRSITLDPRPGATAPLAVETPSALLSDTGLRGPGLQTFLATELPWLAQRGVRTVVSVAGTDLGEWAELGRRVGLSPGVAALEVNLAWPEAATRDSFQAGKVVAAVRRDVPRGIPVLVKIAADLAHVVDLTRAVVKAGADAVVIAAAVPGLALDPVTLRPADAGGPGTLTGPALHAVAMRSVWEVHAALPEVPLVAGGGIRTGLDALGLLAAGARAVQVGTTLLHDPAAPERILAELTAELERRGIASTAAASGIAHRTPTPTHPTGEPR